MPAYQRRRATDCKCRWQQRIDTAGQRRFYFLCEFVTEIHEPATGKWPRPPGRLPALLAPASIQRVEKSACAGVRAPVEHQFLARKCEQDIVTAQGNVGRRRLQQKGIPRRKGLLQPVQIDAAAEHDCPCRGAPLPGNGQVSQGGERPGCRWCRRSRRNWTARHGPRHRVPRAARSPGHNPHPGGRD